MHKKSYLFFTIFTTISTLNVFCQWTWVKGSKTENPPGVFGTVGTAAVANTPPGIYGFYFWDDSNGNIYIYCGSENNNAGNSNTLWHYSIPNNQWKRLKAANNGQQVLGTKGVSAPQNNPGYRDLQGISWLGKNGDLWLYGASGWGSEMWRYSLTTNEWTWMSGDPNNGTAVYGTQHIPDPANSPGNVSEKYMTWTDATGNFWLLAHEVWMYDVNLNQWVWKRGKKENGQNYATANYGTKGVAAPTNEPGYRFVWSYWADSKGCYFFGGQYATRTVNGNSVSQVNHIMADLWSYDHTGNMFTWESGTSNNNDDKGVFGTKCNPSTSIYPPCRIEGRSCVKDKCGNLWLFGGGTYDEHSNDLWKYKPSTKEWTWVSGSSNVTTYQPGNFGTINVPAASNMPPGSRGGFAAFYKGIYIGMGSGSRWDKYTNNIWRYDPPPIADFSFSANTNCGIDFKDLSKPECGGDLQKWEWNFGDGTTSSLQNPSHQYSSSGTFEVTLIVSNCLDIGDTIKKTVNASATFSVNKNITDCSCGASNGSISLTVTPAGNYSFSWTPNVSTSNTASNLPVGTYVVTIKDPVSSCSRNDTIKIKNNADLSLSLVSTSPQNCSTPGSATIQANGTATPFTYTWLPSGGNAATSSGLNAGTYTVVVKDDNNCSDSLTVTITQTGAIPLISETTVPITCYNGKDGSIAINASNGQSPYTFSWNPAALGTNASITNLTAGAYEVTVTDANGCKSSKKIVLTNPGKINATVNASPPGICAGKFSQLSVQATGGTGNFSFNWLPVNMTGASIQVNPTADITYTCVTTDSKNCTDTLLQKITVSPLPTVAFSGSGKACSDTLIFFKDLSTTTQGSISSWLWNFGDGSSSALQNPSHLFNKPGDFSISLQVAVNGCSNTYVCANCVSIYPKPIADFSFVMNGSGEVSYINLSTGASQWLWNFGDNTSSTLLNPQHTFNLDQPESIYNTQLIVTSPYFSCKDTITKPIQINEFVIYIPNTFSPNQDGQNDVFSPAGTGINNSELMIFNRWGQMIYQQRANGLNLSWDGKYNGEKVQEDIYIYSLNYEEKSGRLHRKSGTVNLIR